MFTYGLQDLFDFLVSNKNSDKKLEQLVQCFMKSEYPKVFFFFNLASIQNELLSVQSITFCLSPSMYGPDHLLSLSKKIKVAIFGLQMGPRMNWEKNLDTFNFFVNGHYRSIYKS